MPLFHEITDQEWETMVRKGWTWDDVNEDYRRPDWCRREDAIGVTGCYSLTTRKRISMKFCRACEHFGNVVTELDQTG